MPSLLKNKKFLVSSFIFGLFMLAFNGGHASAATLAVDSGCTLNEAIAAVNDAADGSGCNKTGDAYGTDDTIHLPAGTTTMSANGATVEVPIIFEGVSKASTIVDFDGNRGFWIDFEVSYSGDVTLRDMTVTGATTAGITVTGADHATLNNLEVTDSEKGVNVGAVIHTIVSNCYIHNNDKDDGDQVGLNIGLKANESSDTPSAVVEDTRVEDNSADGDTGFAGVHIQMVDNADAGGNITSNSISTHNLTIINNTAGQRAGLLVEHGNGPVGTVATTLKIDATTVANNVVTVPEAVEVSGGHIPVVSGVYLTGRLAAEQNFTNVTVSGNAVISPTGDNRNTMAGFFGTLNYAGSPMNITNVTVVNNTVTQPSADNTFAAFMVVRVELDLSGYPTIVVNNIANGSTSANGLVAHNRFNGTARNCRKSLDMAAFGFEGTIDATPVGVPTGKGHNMSDDKTCTGYTYASNLWATMDHDIDDNGGPVPTVALHSDSPAINAGREVLGISTDARGVARDGYYSVGAFQGELLAASTSKSNKGTLAVTGAAIIYVSVFAAGLLMLAIVYTFVDYRRHRKPLVQADPYARKTYTYGHHIHSVIIPLLQYRLKISINRNPDGITKF